MTKAVGATTIIGTKVLNHQDNELGKIEEVMIDLPAAKILYLVLSYGGVFGTTMADKRFAVPVDAFLIRHGEEENNVTYILDVKKEFLQNAPGFDKGDYPDFADPRFTRKIHDYYTAVRPAA